MFHCLCYSVTISESKKMFRIIFWCILAIKNIVALSSLSKLPVKLTFCEMHVVVCFDKSMAITL